MKKYLEWIIYAIIMLFVAAALSIFIFGCSSVKQVLKDPKKTDIVGREWERRGNGCVNDTITNVLPGTEITTFDTSYSTDIILTTDSFETNTAVIRYKDRIITKTIIRVDTLIKAVEDTRRLQLITGDLNKERGISATLKDQLKESRKQGTARLLWIIGEGLAILLLGFLLFKQKIK